MVWGIRVVTCSAHHVIMESILRHYTANVLFVSCDPKTVTRHVAFHSTARKRVATIHTYPSRSVIALPPLRLSASPMQLDGTTGLFIVHHGGNRPESRQATSLASKTAARMLARLEGSPGHERLTRAQTMNAFHNDSSIARDDHRRAFVHLVMIHPSYLLTILYGSYRCCSN